MRTRFFPAAELVNASGHLLTPTPDGRGCWSVAGHHGFVVVGPNASVENGVYRVKAHARVASPEPHRSYLEVMDFHADGRIYGATTFRSDPELYVRVLRSNGLEFRFRTAGEHLVVDGVELEAVLLDDDPAGPDALKTVLDRLEAAGAGVPAFLRVVDRLGDLGEAEAAERRRSAYLRARAAAKPQTEVLRRLWKLHGPVSALTLPVEERPVTWEQIGEVTSALDMQVVDLLSPTPERRELLRRFGYDADHIEATRVHRDYDEPPRPWSDRRAETGAPPVFPSRQPLFEPYALIDRSHQTAQVRGRGFPAYCPVTGRLLRSLHAFLIHFEQRIFIFHRFEGAEVFYVCTGVDSDARMFVYMPRSQLIGLISDPWHRAYPHQQLARDLAFNLAMNAEACAAYLRNPTRPVAVTGNFNYGHFFWCDLSGVQFAVENGLHHHLAGMVKTPFQFIEPEALFPEFQGKAIHDCANQVYAFKACVENGYLPVHFTNTSMNDALVERVRAWGRRNAVPELGPPRDAPRPLLWLNLRAHNKRWVDQAAGYANILNALHDRYGAVSALLDGVPDCQSIADEIRTLTRREVPLYDGLHLGLADKLAWAAAADGYICVIGTGLVIAHSLAGAKGVGHGNQTHLTQLGFWDSIHPGSGTPLGPTPDEVTDLGEGGMNCDYQVDWRVLLRLIRQVLDARLEAENPA